MWRVEYIGEDLDYFGRFGWAELTADPETINVRFDGESEWRPCDADNFEVSEY